VTFRRERPHEPDAPAEPRRVGDHRLVGLQHRDVGKAARDSVDAGPERRAREENAANAGADRVLREVDEARGHRVVEPVAARREIGRKAVVQYIHAHATRPRVIELGVDRRDRMGERVD